MRPVSDHMRPVSYRQNRAHNGWRQSLSKLYSFGTRLFIFGLEMIHIPILRGWDNMRHWHWQIGVRVGETVAFLPLCYSSIVGALNLPNFAQITAHYLLFC